MSRSSYNVARRVSGFFSSLRNPERSAFRALEEERENERFALPDDKVGEPIMDDRYAKMADEASAWLDTRERQLKELESHELVVSFGFTVTDLIGQDGLPLGFDHLGVVTEACRAVRELGFADTCRVMGIRQDNGTTSLCKISIYQLFRFAGALSQAVLEARRALRAKQEAVRLARKERERIEQEARLERERIEQEARIEREREEEEAADFATESLGTNFELDFDEDSDFSFEEELAHDWLGRYHSGSGATLLRCTCGCEKLVKESEALLPPFSEMEQNQDGRVEMWDLHRHVRAPKCVSRRVPTFLFERTLKAMLKKETDIPGNNLRVGVIGEEGGESHPLSRFVCKGFGVLSKELGREPTPKEILASRVPAWEVNPSDGPWFSLLKCINQARENERWRQENREKTNASHRGERNRA